MSVIGVVWPRWSFPQTTIAAMALTDADLEEMLSAHESDRVELKSSIANKDRICEAICAFANDLPGHDRRGVVFVGVDDNGRPTGLDVTDGLLQSLAALRSDGNILPPPNLVVTKRRLRGADIAVVEVQPSRTPPVRYRGRVFIRVGPRRAIASADEERRLSEKRRAADTPFDSRAMVGSTIEDLDEDLFLRQYLPQALPQEVLAENSRTLGQRLAALRLAAPDGTPTGAGMLLIGREPESWIPGSVIQMIRIQGPALTDPIADQKRLSGPLVDVLRQVDELLELNIAVRTNVTADRLERRSPDYPLAALQQVVRNAVMHRNYEHTSAPTRVTWYDDRVEVVSPGGPYGFVTPENFGHPGITDYRNPTLAEGMRALGYVQRFGIGLAIVGQAMSDNGNPDPEFDVTTTHVSVTLRRRS